MLSFAPNHRVAFVQHLRCCRKHPIPRPSRAPSWMQRSSCPRRDTSCSPTSSPASPAQRTAMRAGPLLPRRPARCRQPTASSATKDGFAHASLPAHQLGPAAAAPSSRLTLSVAGRNLHHHVEGTARRRPHRPATARHPPHANRRSQETPLLSRRITYFAAAQRRQSPRHQSGRHLHERESLHHQRRGPPPDLV